MYRNKREERDRGWKMRGGTKRRGEGGDVQTEPDGGGSGGNVQKEICLPF